MKTTPLLLTLLVLYSCSKGEYADTVYINAQFHSLDSTFSVHEAMAIKGEKILAMDSEEKIQEYINGSTKQIDLGGKYVFPGFIEGHGHFAKLGELLTEVNLFEAKTWEEVELMVNAKIDETDQLWIIGQGWHQEKWDSLPNVQVDGYPTSQSMDLFTIDRPVMLFHASGHALFANKAAMSAAGINSELPDPAGGRILRDEKGNPTGIFEERAMDLIKDEYKAWYQSLDGRQRQAIEWHQIEVATQECLSKGVTSFQDAGSKIHHVNLYKSLSLADSLDIRLWVMLREDAETTATHLTGLPYIDASNTYFTCRAIKSEIDGALGSYGAWLLRPYDDKAGFFGQNTTELSEVEALAKIALENNMQLCVHAIGDRGNQEILNMMDSLLGDQSKDKRWRIEHAQHLHPADIPRFAEIGIIASMQGIHCTSDAPFVEKRLGRERAQHGAYVWNSLLKSGAIVSNGTDAPIEDVDPLKNLFALVTRSRTDNGMVFFKEQAISRKQALHSMTTAAAYAGFEEDVKGSLEPKKFADFIVIDTDIMNCTDEEILKARILNTYVGGQLKYSL